jgi:hypothetical protein
MAAAVLCSGVLEATAGGQSNKRPPGKRKAPPCKPTPKGKQHKPKKVIIHPTRYSGQAVAVNLKNVMTGQVLELAETGRLPAHGGSLETTLGAASVGDLLSIGGAKVTTSGIGGVANSRAEVQNFTAVFVHLGVTNVIAFTYAAAEARAECTSNGVVLTASSLVEGLTIDGTNVVVTGETNQVITIAAGNIVLNAQMTSVSGNGQQEITVAAIFLMLTDCFQGPIAYAEAGVKCGSSLPPSMGDCGKVTGGGFIVTTLGDTNTVSTNTVSDAHGSFGVSGGIRRGQFWGHLNYIDHGTGMHVSSTAVTGFAILDAVTRQIDYDVTIDGVAGTARVIVADNGEPGRNDLFDITLSTGYHAGGDLGGTRPGGGNIQLHKCPPGWAK